MIKLNNKGQTLVMFIIVMPVILFALILAIDLGSAYSTKQELDSINQLALSYGLDRLTSPDVQSKIIEYINLNTTNLDNIDVRITDDEILISTTKNVSGIISHAFNIKSYEVTSAYVGSIKDNKKIKKKVK